MSVSDRPGTSLALGAGLCHGFAVLLVCVWIASTDIFFGHKQGPTEYLILAALAAAAGAGLTITWFKVSAGKRAWGTAVLQGMLLPLSFLIMWMGYAQYSYDANREARRYANVPPQKVPAVKAVERANKGKATKVDVPALEKALYLESDQSWEAAVALKNLGPEAEPAIPGLVDAIHRGATPPDAEWKTPLRVYSGDALAAIGPAAVPALIKLLSDEKPGARLAATEALGRIKSQESLAAIAGVRQDPDEKVRKAAESALRGTR